MARSSESVFPSPNRAFGREIAQHLSTGRGKPLRENANLGIFTLMEGDRSEAAMARIEAALARIDAAARNLGEKSAAPQPPASVMNLINKHEALREEVASVIGELDQLIAGLEP